MLIARRFCGPPDSGNGGYTAGLLASQLEGTIEVTLRRPPPLDRELALQVAPDRAAALDGHLVVAEARVTELALDVPVPPSFERASEAALHYPGFQKHHFPGCFACGPERAAGDGLRIFPGALGDGEPMAAPFEPAADLCDAAGRMCPEFLWAGLDCIGYFAVAGPDYPRAVLGRMTADLSGAITVGERCVVLGWTLGRDGRKLHAGTAIYGQDGQCRARARQTWIVI